MQAWAKRGIQTALVTGGLLMLGTGIASADEDVNPDKPASPLDMQTRFRFDAANNALHTPVGTTNLPSANRDLSVSPRDVADEVGDLRQQAPAALANVRAKPTDAPATLLKEAKPPATNVIEHAKPMIGEVASGLPVLPPQFAQTGSTPGAERAAGDLAPVDVSGDAAATLGRATHQNWPNPSSGFLTPHEVDLDWTVPVQVHDTGDVAGLPFKPPVQVDGMTAGGLGDVAADSEYPGQNGVLTYLTTDGDPAQATADVVEPALGDDAIGNGEASVSSRPVVDPTALPAGDPGLVANPLAGALWASGNGTGAVASAAESAATNKVIGGVTALRDNDRSDSLVPAPASQAVPDVQSLATVEPGLGETAVGDADKVVRPIREVGAAAGVPATADGRTVRKTVLVMSRTSRAAPVGLESAVYDVPGDVLAEALTTATDDGVVVNERSQRIQFPVVPGAASPTTMPSLLPFGRLALWEQVRPVAPADDLTGAFSGVLDDVTGGLVGEPARGVVQTVAHSALDRARTTRSNPFPRLTGDLFGTGLVNRGPARDHEADRPIGRDLPGGDLLGGVLGGSSPVSGLLGQGAGGLPVAGSALGGGQQGGLPVVGNVLGGQQGGLPVVGGALSGGQQGGLPVVGDVLGGQQGGLPVVGSALGSSQQGAGGPLGGLLGQRDTDQLPVVGNALGAGQSSDGLPVMGNAVSGAGQSAGRLPTVGGLLGGRESGVNSAPVAGNLVEVDSSERTERTATDLPNVGQLPVANGLPATNMPVVNGQSLDGGLPATDNLANDLPVVSTVPMVTGLFGTVSDQQAMNAVTTLLPVSSGNRHRASDFRTVVPRMPSVTDVDVTQIIPTIPSVTDMRTFPGVQVPTLDGVPAMANFPAIDPGSLTDTRAALDNLFTNHPIG
jgi:hypothetical protein